MLKTFCLCASVECPLDGWKIGRSGLSLIGQTGEVASLKMHIQPNFELRIEEKATIEVEPAIRYGHSKALCRILQMIDK